MSLEPELHTETTLDPFLGGRLNFLQPKKGYRFSVDAPLLAGFIDVRPDDRVADLGAGCGVVGILLAHFTPIRRLVAVEVQAELAGLARRNAELNGFSDLIRIRNQDVSDFVTTEPSGSYDLVVSNPPFQPVGASRPSSHPQRAVARQEILLTPASLFAAASRLLRTGGRLGLVHRPWRWPELRPELERHGLHPSRIRPVVPRDGEGSNLILVEAVKGVRNGSEELAPLVLFGEQGVYTEEAEALLKHGIPFTR